MFKTDIDHGLMKRSIIQRFTDFKKLYYGIREKMFENARNNSFDNREYFKTSLIEFLRLQYTINALVGYNCYKLFSTNDNSVLTEFTSDLYTKNKKLFKQDWTSTVRGDNIKRFFNTNKNYLSIELKALLAKHVDDKSEDMFRKFMNVYESLEHGTCKIELYRERYLDDIDTCNDTLFNIRYGTLKASNSIEGCMLYVTVYRIFEEVKEKVIDAINIITKIGTLIDKQKYCKNVQGYVVARESNDIHKAYAKISLFIDEDNYYYGVDDIIIENDYSFEECYNVFIPNFTNESVIDIYAHCMIDVEIDGLLEDSIVESDNMTYSDTIEFDFECNVLPELFMESICTYERLPDNRDIVGLNKKLFDTVSFELKYIYDSMYLCECESCNKDCTNDELVCKRYKFNMDEFEGEYEEYYEKFYSNL
jgi:hypothetical protein